MPINDVQTTNRQHAVPQNIMDVEFKIIGDLTMRQFIYLMVFGAIAYGAFVGISGFFKWPIIIICALAGVAFAFLPIEERGVDQWIINFFKAVYSPNQRIWRKEPEIPVAFSFENMEMVRTELIALTPTSSRRKLEEFLNTQNKQHVIDPLDIPEADYMLMVREAFATTTVDTQVTAPVYAPVVDTVPQEQPSEATEQKPTESKEQHIQEKSEDNKQTQDQIADKTTSSDTTQQKTEPQIAQRTQPKQREHKKSNRSLIPMTPDQHTGRRFTNLLPKEGEIVLPIRGERVLKTSDEQKIDEGIEEKAKQLKQLLDQITKEENISLPSKQNAQPPKETIPQQVSNEQTQPVQAQVVQQTQQPATDNKTEATPGPKTQSTDFGVGANYATIAPLTNKPNIISGIVKDLSNNPLQGLVLIIKNEKDEPVRALKTNPLGQFSISTPLANGRYIIETDKSKKTSLSFDIINLEANGNVIPPVEIIGK